MLDHADVPFEIWCDSLEDDGITTEDLRLLFNQNNGVRDDYCSTESYYYRTYVFGSGLSHGYEYGRDQGYGCGAEYSTSYRFECETTGRSSLLGSGHDYGYGERENE